MRSMGADNRPPRVASANASSWIVVATALGILLPALIFVWLRLATPSDGARIAPGTLGWRSEGVELTPLVDRPDGLRAGDVIVAVDEQSLETWAERLATPGISRPRWTIGQRVTYGVIRDGHPENVSVILIAYPLDAVIAQTWGTILLALGFQAVVTFVFLRRPREPSVGALLLAASSLLSATTWSFGLQVGDVVGATGFWLFQATTGAAFAFCLAFALHFALLFPRPLPFIVGHPGRVAALYASPVALSALYLVTVRAGAFNTLDWIGRWPTGQYLIIAAYIVAIVATISVSYRTSGDRDTRRKVRWFLFGLGTAATGYVILWIAPTELLGHPLIGVNELGILSLLVPVTLAIAILRHQLFDIDVIINRALVYGILTGSLAALYFGSIVLLQQLFRVLASQQSDLAIVASTLTIAAVFTPLRRRIQASVDRRFYRTKYDTSRVLAAFGEAVRDEVDLSALTAELLSVVEETMQPAHVSLWLRGTTTHRRSGEHQMTGARR